MFEHVGRDVDPQAAGRKAAAFVLTAGIGAGLAGAVALVGLLHVAEAVVAPVAEAAMVELILPEDALDDLEAPPPPAARAGSSGAEAEPEPELSSEAVPELPPEVAPAVTEAAGQPDGQSDGARDGVEDGHPQGQAGGTGTDPLGAVPTLHSSELTVKRRVLPDYPEAAREAGFGEVACRVRLFIDESGAPYDLVFEACPSVFQPSAREALSKWRWYPARVGDTKIKAQFLMNIRYTLH